MTDAVLMPLTADLAGYHRIAVGSIQGTTPRGPAQPALKPQKHVTELKQHRVNQSCIHAARLHEAFWRLVA